MTHILKKTMVIGNDILIFETGKIAMFANGSVLGKYGETVVLSTTTVSEEVREGIDFFPLTVDVEEKMYASGKIPGGFIKRENRPGERAILTARLIDRPIRPLFPKEYKNDIQIISTVLSIDENHEADILAINCSSASLHLSKAPFLGPIGAVRVGYIDGKYIINPNDEERKISTINLTVAGTKNEVVMVEAGANFVSEEIIMECILKGHEEIKKIVNFIEEFKKDAEKLELCKKKIEFVSEMKNNKFVELSKNHIIPEIKNSIDFILKNNLNKEKRDAQIKKTLENLILTFFKDKKEELIENPKLLIYFKEIFYSIKKDLIRNLIMDKKIRIDNRKLTEIRQIKCELDLLPRTHGSALFTRGETQILSVTTLASTGNEQNIDDIHNTKDKNYFHQYNFPPYSVGESRPMRGPGRREIGHGNLAERALIPVLPNKNEFPYVIRVVSEALSSNGSTSMASVCGSSLSLMAAGVPIKSPVAGIAMGLIKKNEDIEILSDIQGLEDHLGDMDFKVTGNEKGITALQMDIKISGITKEILKKALYQAKEGRLHILKIMNNTILESRTKLSKYAPKIISIKINPDKIREIIGAGGKIIKKIIEETGADINITNDGTVEISSIKEEVLFKTKEIIKKIIAEVEIGKIYKGKVIKITEFGAFVQIIEGIYGNSGKEGLVHISQLDNKRVNKVEDIVKEGDQILVKAIEIDKLGRLKLSRKEALLDSDS